MSYDQLALRFHIQPIGSDEYLTSLFRENEQVRLGLLATLAVQVARIQQTSEPEFCSPYMLLLAADHGLITEDSCANAERTVDRVRSIAEGNQLLNALCRMHGFSMRIVDAGLVHPIDEGMGVSNWSLGHGTADILTNAQAMDSETCLRAIEAGRQLTREVHEVGSNLLSFGIVAKGARISASLWANAFTGLPLTQSLPLNQIAQWSGGEWGFAELERICVSKHSDRNPLQIFQRYGGFEMVMAVGAMLQAAELRMTILIDCFSAIVALLGASKLYPEVTQYAILTQMEKLSSMQQIATMLELEPVSLLHLYASEGIGSLSAYQTVRSALALLSIPKTAVAR